MVDPLKSYLWEGKIHSSLNFSVIYQIWVRACWQLLSPTCFLQHREQTQGPRCCWAPTLWGRFQSGSWISECVHQRSHWWLWGKGTPGTGLLWKHTKWGLALPWCLHKEKWSESSFGLQRSRALAAATACTEELIRTVKGLTEKSQITPCPN